MHISRVHFQLALYGKNLITFEELSNFEVFFHLSNMIVTGLIVSLFATVALCSDVIELDDQNFKSGTDGKDIMLVEFFAPW